MIDLHMHLLPGLDDGPTHIGESIEMCRLALEDGVKTVVATPHMLNGVYGTTREDILRGVAHMKRILKDEDIGLEVLPGADVHLHFDLIHCLEEGRIMTLADGGRYLLLELPGNVIPRGLDRHFISLNLAGVTPILTHPERSFEVQSDPGLLLPLIRSGALLQVTAGSFSGEFGQKAMRTAFSLLDLRMAHLVASDAHGARQRTPGLSVAFDLVKKRIGARETEEIFLHRPERILAGKEISLPEIRRKRWTRGLKLFKRSGA